MTKHILIESPDHSGAAESVAEDLGWLRAYMPTVTRDGNRHRRIRPQATMQQQQGQNGQAGQNGGGFGYGGYGMNGMLGMGMSGMGMLGGFPYSPQLGSFQQVHISPAYLCRMKA